MESYERGRKGGVPGTNLYNGRGTTPDGTQSVHIFGGPWETTISSSSTKNVA